MVQLPVEPGCGPLMLEPHRVSAGVRTSREGAWTLAAPSDSPSPDTAHSLGRRGGPSPGPPGHFAQKGYGQTHRDLELGWKESQHQDRDAGWLLSEVSSFDRQFQSWRGPATALFSLAARHAGDSSLRVNS